MKPEENQESVGKWRKSKGFSQSALAEKIGVSQASASRIESGEQPTEEVEKALRRLGYTGPLGIQAPSIRGIPDILDQIEEAVLELRKRGVKPQTAEKAHELRKLVGRVIERSPGVQPLADEVEEWIRAAEAFRK